jgi:hypothetical protein
LRPARALLAPVPPRAHLAWFPPSVLPRSVIRRPWSRRPWSRRPCSRRPCSRRPCSQNGTTLALPLAWRHRTQPRLREGGERSSAGPMMRISRLCRAAAGVSQGTVRGAGMRQAQYARRIRAGLLRDPLDRRRWDGRTGVSCGKQWTKIKAACVKFHACGRALPPQGPCWGTFLGGHLALCGRVVQPWRRRDIAPLRCDTRKELPSRSRESPYYSDGARIRSHQPSFRSSWKHSSLVETDPSLPWVLRNI